MLPKAGAARKPGRPPLQAPILGRGQVTCRGSVRSAAPHARAARSAGTRRGPAVSLRRGRAPTPLPAAAPGGRVRERCVAPAASAVTGPDASLA